MRPRCSVSVDASDAAELVESVRLNLAAAVAYLADPDPVWRVRARATIARAVADLLDAETLLG